ncbi:MAG: superoxide dismutase [Ni] [Verrucomicrobiota bacterium]
MKIHLSVLAGAVLFLSFANQAFSHCQVPCGIFSDQLRFEQMLEDQVTMAKAAAQIVDLAGKSDAQSLNQLSRWVTTKEEHAASIQATMASYFFAQRIKSSAERYDAQLKTGHAVVVAAMKAKQTVGEEEIAALKTAILEFYTAYEGKEPAFE